MNNPYVSSGLSLKSRLSHSTPAAIVVGVVPTIAVVVAVENSCVGAIVPIAGDNKQRVGVEVAVDYSPLKE